MDWSGQPNVLLKRGGPSTLVQFSGPSSPTVLGDIYRCTPNKGLERGDDQCVFKEHCRVLRVHHQVKLLLLYSLVKNDEAAGSTSDMKSVGIIEVLTVEMLGSWRLTKRWSTMGAAGPERSSCSTRALVLKKVMAWFVT